MLSIILNILGVVAILIAIVVLFIFISVIVLFIRTRKHIKQIRSKAGKEQLEEFKKIKKKYGNEIAKYITNTDIDEIDNPKRGCCGK